MRCVADKERQDRVFEVCHELFEFKKRAVQNLLSSKGIEMRIKRSSQVEGKGKTDCWIAPADLEPEVLKKSNQKKLMRKQLMGQNEMLRCLICGKRAAAKP